MASGLVPQPAYSSADRNLRVAEQIAGELETLEGDELRERMCRMEHLGSRSRHLRLMGAELAIAETHRLCAAGWMSLRSAASVKSDRNQQDSQSASA